ncbi:MAG: tRNA (guanosine(37)-N1)-methyltransferase TrmD [Fimbriimonadaceae bacterium]|nr:tRNA (guanosine(37)-N1)-methyltransferase TrmD [Fimbriimonadaceae bacterium]
MRFDLLSTIPAVFESWRNASILARGQAAGAIDIRVHDLRDWATDRHRTLDDYPFGGGAGMVLKAEPLCRAVAAVSASGAGQPEVLLLCPQGQPFTQAVAHELAAQPWLVLLCGRYEGVDERVRELVVTRELSLGDFVLTGGEVAAMAVVEAVARLVPGVLGDAASAADESFSEPLLEYPQYTRPAEYAGAAVPGELLSGHHERVRLWRRMEQLRRTLDRRPDLVARWQLTAEDRRLLARVI